MTKFAENIKNVFGDSGRAWLNALPVLIDELVMHWGLTQVVPVDNMTFNYVAKAFSPFNQPVVLKISFDAKSIQEERQALMYFDNHAAVKLMDSDEKRHAMLLQQAIPGTTLKSFYPTQIEFVMDCYVNTIHKLHSKVLPTQYNYRHIRDWLTAIDALKPCQLPDNFLSKAISLRDFLLGTLGRPVFLHGDLHHDNVIDNGSEWLAIDPKGIVGEVEFEIAAFDFIHVSELHDKSLIKKLFADRITRIAQKSNLNPQRISDWVFVRLMMAAAWSIEDNCDPGWAIHLAECLA